METFEIEISRNNVSPAEFLRYVRNRVDQKGGEMLRSDLDMDYFKANNDLNFDTRHEDGTREKSVSKPYKMQTFVAYPNGTKYNEICEFEFDDEKRGHGYYYLINVSDEVETPVESVQGAVTETEDETQPITEKPVESVQEEKKMENKKVSISSGNRKMGAIPSVSLPPILTCPAGCPCAKKCYSAKMCRIYPTVKKSYQNNLDILNEDWDAYWLQVRAAVSMVRYFRFHVAGDIPNAAYFKEMVITAKQFPGTRILAFTKQYDIVNHYIDTFGDLPENLHVIFSRWDDAWNAGIHNPHNLPMSTVIFKGCDPLDAWKICGGNCTECACRGVGCWELKKGETIAFYEH